MGLQHSSHSDCGNTELSHRGILIPLGPGQGPPKVWHRRGARRGCQSGAGPSVRTPQGLSLTSGLMHSKVSKKKKAEICIGNIAQAKFPKDEGGLHLEIPQTP